MSILATKSIEQIEREQLGGPGLKRVLGPTQLMMLGVGAIIGTGIFVLTGQAAAANAGPAIVISMVVAGLASALAGLCYSEFAASVPVAGSAYTYAYATLGEFVAWIIGWDSAFRRPSAPRLEPSWPLRAAIRSRPFSTCPLCS
jgi:basic amino acid/polyamine antiporter, APA family